MSIRFRLDELRTETRRPSLMALMADFGALKCTDFHDHVYGPGSLAIQGGHLRVDYDSSLLTLFLTTLHFCRRHGASFPKKPCCFLAPEQYVTRLVSIQSHLKIRALWSCHCRHFVPRCGFLFRNHYDHSSGVSDAASSKVSTISTSSFTFCPSTLFCLAAEVARVHLLSFSKAKFARRQKRKAVLILTFPSDENRSDPGELPEHMTDAVTIISSSPTSNSPYHHLCLTPTDFLRILHYEHTKLEDILPRSQQLCMMSVS
jgi:hypothetical protein